MSLLKMICSPVSLHQGEILLSQFLIRTVFLLSFFSTCGFSSFLAVSPALALLQSSSQTGSAGGVGIVLPQHKAAQPISFSHNSFPSSLSLSQSKREHAAGSVQTREAEESSSRINHGVAFLSPSPAAELFASGGQNNPSLRTSSAAQQTSLATSDSVDALAPIAFNRGRAPAGVTALRLTADFSYTPSANGAADGTFSPSQLQDISTSSSPMKSTTSLGRRGRAKGKYFGIKGGHFSASKTASAALKALSSTTASLLPGSRGPSVSSRRTCKKNKSRMHSLKKRRNSTTTSLNASRNQHFGKGKGGGGGGGRGSPSRRPGGGATAGVRRIEDEDDDEFEGEEEEDEEEEEDDEDYDDDDDIEDELEGEDEEEEEDEEDDEEYDPMTPRGPLDSNNYGEVWLPVQPRPRRNRKNRAVRQLIQESVVKPSSLIYPLFVQEGDVSTPIASMPGQKRLSMADLLKEVGEAKRYGVNAFMLFPRVEDSLKTNMGEESYNPDGLLPRAIMALKEAYPDILVLADVALDPYSTAGQDGVVDEETGKVLNDISVHQLCKQALTLARAGADMVCPSDMMDGRVSAIRESLDMEGCIDTSVLSYTCKYASSFYGPFRDALSSHVRPGMDKRTYQMDFSNTREAEREAELDAAEGADMLMVKPGVPYLDVLSKVREKSRLPVAAYHVSGEYAMLKAAAERGWIDEKQAVLETLKGFRRAGADAIATYYAKDVAKWMTEDATSSSGEKKFTEPCY